MYPALKQGCAHFITYLLLARTLIKWKAHYEVNHRHRCWCLSDHVHVHV